MNVKFIIQCRMNSSRYPGKVLAPFLGKPLLAHIVDRIKSAKLKSSIILATSNKRSDDPLEIYGKYLGIIVERGSLDDVSKRFALVLKKHKCEAFLESVEIVHYCQLVYLIKHYLFIKKIHMI